jgi:hypothetical protein
MRTPAAPLLFAEYQPDIGTTDAAEFRDIRTLRAGLTPRVRTDSLAAVQCTASGRCAPE